MVGEVWKFHTIDFTCVLLSDIVLKRRKGSQDKFQISSLVIRDP